MTKLPIVGARFRPPAEEVLQLLPAGAELILRRQPENPYDTNAVAVLLSSGDYGSECEPIFREYNVDFPLHLGFIPRADVKLPMDAARLAPLMDLADVIEDVKATLTFGSNGSPMVQFEEPSNE